MAHLACGIRAGSVALALFALMAAGCESRLVIDTPPEAVAGPDAAVAVGGSSVLEGGIKLPSDVDIEPDSIEWSFAVVPSSASEQEAAVLSDPESSSTELFVNEPGLYVLRLDVSHGGRAGVPAYLNVMARSDPLPPVAVAGPNVEVGPGEKVQLDGSGSHSPDGRPLAYTWTQLDGEGVTLDEPQSSITSFEAPLEAGTLAFSLTVVDDLGLSDQDEVQVTVLERPPVAHIDAPEAAGELETVVLDGSASFDPNGGPLSFSWSVVGDPQGVELFSPDAEETSFVAPRVDDGDGRELEIELEVESEQGASASSSTTILIERTIVALAIGEEPPPSVEAGAPFTIAVDVVHESGERALGADDVVEIDLADDTGVALLGERRRAATDGRAVFDDLHVLDVVQGLRIEASSAGLEGATTRAFDVQPGVATHLVITEHPSQGVAGEPLVVRAEARDENGNVHEGYHSQVDLQIVSGPVGATISGTPSVVAESGAAVFSNVLLDQVGPYTLGVTSGALDPDQTGNIEVEAGPPAQLAFSTPPRMTSVGTCSDLVTLETRDQVGNVSPTAEPLEIELTSDSGTMEIFAGDACPEGEPISALGLEAGESTASVRFWDEAAGSPTIIADAQDFSAAEQTHVVEHGSAVALEVKEQPSEAVGAGEHFEVVAEALDPFGNLDEGFDGEVAVAIHGIASEELLDGPTEISAEAGVATFSQLSIEVAGEYVLVLSSEGLDPGFTEPISISPSAPIRLAITSDAQTVEVGSCSSALVFVARDAFDNPSPVVDDTPVSVAVTSTTMQVFEQEGCTGAHTDEILLPAGEAHGELFFQDEETGAVDITLDATSLMSAEQQQSIVPAPPEEIVFTTGSHNVTAGACSPLVQLESRDGSGFASPVTSDVSIQLSSDSSTLSFYPHDDCNPGREIEELLLAEGEHTARFRFVDLTAGDSTIQADPEGFDSLTQDHTIGHGLATTLAFVGEPPEAVEVDTGFDVSIEARDDYGNRDFSFSDVVTLDIHPDFNPGGASLFGDLELEAEDGVVSFEGIGLDAAGDGYRLEATSGGLHAAVSRGFEVFVEPTVIVVTSHPQGSHPLGSHFDVWAEARDDDGRIGTGFDGPVTIEMESGPSEASLRGQLTVDASAGVLHFEELFIDWPGDGVRLRITDDSASLDAGFTDYFDVSHFEAGAGTEADPYDIANVYQLQAMMVDLEAWYLLVSDIDASDTHHWDFWGSDGFLPIGNDDNRFTGDLEGQGHFISDLYIDAPGMDWVGLFGAIGAGGRVRHVCLENVDVTGDTNVGAIAGVVREDGRVVRSCARGQVAGDTRVGGLVGLNDYRVRDSYARVVVTGTDSEVGGLVGRNQDGRVQRCYSTGQVSGAGSYVGGLVGRETSAWGGESRNSFWDSETSGQSSSDGGTAKTTTEMHDVATFTDESTSGLDGAWDFVGDPNDDDGDNDFWDIDDDTEEGYPFLRIFFE